MTQRSALGTIPANKAAQFLLGVAILFAAFKLWSAGWFSAAVFSATEYHSTDGLGSVTGILAIAIDSVCLVGVAAFALLGLLRSTVSPLIDGAGTWLRSRVELAPAPTQPSDPQIDPEKLSDAINDLNNRIAGLEKTRPAATRSRAKK